MKRAWMPIYIGDYLGDTGHLTTGQHGAYFLLMMHYWRKGELPDDDRQLATICKLPLGIWTQHYRETLSQLFLPHWKHKRIEIELGKMQAISDKRKEAGFKGGIRSAMSRMKLEDESNSRPNGKQLLEPIAKQMLPVCSAFARPLLDHSHSQRITTTSSVSEDEQPKEESKDGSLATAHIEGALREPSRKDVASPELLLAMSRKTPRRGAA